MTPTPQQPEGAVLPKGNLRLPLPSAFVLAVASLFVLPEGNLRFPLAFAVAVAVAPLFVLPKGNLRLLLASAFTSTLAPSSTPPKAKPRPRLSPRTATLAATLLLLLPAHPQTLERRQIRQALSLPATLPALSPQTYGTFHPTPTVTAERLSYLTEDNQRVPAILYRPTTLHRHLPALLLVAGHGGDKSSWYTYYTAILYAQAGAVVLTYDALGTNESSDDHKPGDNEHDRPIETPASMPARTGGRMVADILQGVSLLAQRHDVDPKRIAVLGFSMGSFHAALAGALDPQIHALLLTGGGDLDGPGGYWESSHALMCQSGPYKALRLLGDVPARLFALNAARGNTFILNGTNDTVVDIPHHGPDFFAALRQRTIALRGGSDRGVFTTYFDPGASHRPNWMTPTAATWLNSQLHFPRWSTLGPPEPMRTWAAAVGYTLGKSSAREDRDAGLPILTANVPLLSPTELDILPLDQWQARKQDFTYTPWIQKAEAQAEAQAEAKAKQETP